MINGLVAIIIAYLLGSIPSSYIITRLKTGKDIRKLGGGNAGARNVYREVGLAAAIPVAVFDIGKGAAAVAIAYWGLEALPVYVMAAGLAAVAGHIWSVYLKFTGGNGLATTIGVLSLLMSRELLIILGIMLALTVFTRNPILSLNIGLLSLPVSAWFLEKSWLYVIFAIWLIVIMAINFVPIAKAALAGAGSRERLFTELLRIKKAGKEKG
ncbi:MAG: glycerol-3-phosphate acyltransferase [Dehalococcoidales bacterium]|nr:glycerol-3-phosphate acyltransferase [Dehalococcoidales bacterium]